MTDTDKYGDPIDEAHRPLVEAGEGEDEGFDVAEADLIEHASHGDPATDPTELAGKPEERTGAEYGESDHVESNDE
jgi:hypothetical protein